MDETPAIARRARLGQNPRALTTIVSVIVVALALVLVGVTAFAVLGGFSPNAKPSCQPAGTPACDVFLNFHDVALHLPLKSIQQGGLATFTATLPSGETATSYSFNFGDGSKVATGTLATVAHVFRTPGMYLVGVTALIAGQPHDNYQSLVQVAVTPSFAADTNLTLPGISGNVVSNSTPSGAGLPPTAVISLGGTVTLSATYTSAPTNPLWQEVPPKLVYPTGVALSKGGNLTATSAGGTFQFNQAGTYTLGVQGGSTDLITVNTTTPPLVYQNFSWTVFVFAPPLHAGVQGAAPPHSPHPGTIIVYEDLPGGARTEDPAIAYDTGSYEAIANVYQPLITYNGTQNGPTPDVFVPAIATCVPGPNSQSCAKLYGGNTLYDATTQSYTFVISSAPHFYDPRTGGSWGVYPSDVVFSVARTLGFGVQPCVGCNNGWILSQALLGPGNFLWDSLHGPYNNTPLDVLNSMSVNDSTCTSLTGAMTNDHGCVTFHANGHGQPWPYFLELVADQLGGSIVPCGWFSAVGQGAGIPYWTAGNSSGSGDHPCQMPGVGGYGLPAASIPYVGWDQWETIGSGATGKFVGSVQYNMVGSGPYYSANYEVGIAYELKASPAYAPNPHCTWTGCYPQSGKYANTVQVTWESDITEGEQALATGVADFAAVPSTDLSFLIQLINKGQVNAESTPTLNVGFEPFNLNFNVGTATQYTTQPITIPNDFFSHLGVRQFLVHTYPYQTVQTTINTRDGITLGFLYGGAIPQFMANYYPKDIPWPTGDPCNTASNTSCAGYWWAQLHNASGPYFDPEISGCSSSSPCQFPVFGTTGDPTGDEILSLWTNWVATESGGAIKMNPVDVNFNTLLLLSQSSTAGSDPMPIYGLGWAPDYPDPTDYTTPLYLPNATYTGGDSVATGLYTAAYSQGSCANPSSDYNYYANNSFPEGCQAIAYKAMVKLLGTAGGTPAGPLRVLLYDIAEKIANRLALYVYTSQGNALVTASSWVNLSSINLNVMLGGVGTYFWVTGNGIATG
ncbi:MAG: ABC transporter substrate-binding protein [Thermoplasmata archaeon]|nr:ABC transporter substrate-binding protein [Thermoplasmata archaeon]